MNFNIKIVRLINNVENDLSVIFEVKLECMVAELRFPVKKAWHVEGKICLLMTDNKEIRFPVDKNKKLLNATVEQRNNIEIICGGTGLHWPDLDEDLSVIGIIEGRYGN